MSRNLCRRDCYFCEGAVRATEPPRLIRREDAGGYFSEFMGMVVAAGACCDCEAKYLLWLGGWFHGRNNAIERDEEGNPLPHDLSFRSTFNDQPGEADLPLYEIHTVRSREPLEGIPIVKQVSATSNADRLEPYLKRWPRKREP